MCILCVIQKWSRRVATMLPWLVVPLICLWAVSQFFPPAFRFEITSPRLACVFVLLITLFWYEILMPQLSAWRVKRNARARERKRLEAIEMQKMRKTATRRCRNCLTPYKDQNPGGGRFMCSYCGHVSKRPVLDLNGKVSLDNSLICGGQEWLENGNSLSRSKLSHWQKSSGILFGGDDHCTDDKSFFCGVIFVCKPLTFFFVSIRRLLGNLSSSSEDELFDAEHRDMMAKKGENEFNESRSDKSRRKAEEKRQARLEKELLEEEEKKQREEVARLVEERRRLRNEKTEAEIDQKTGSSVVIEGHSKKEAKNKRRERSKDRDKGSSKSNSDVEELEKKTGKESERKMKLDNKIDLINGLKSVTANKYAGVNAGTRYFDRMKGSFLSSSKAFGGGNFFGKGVNSSAIYPKEKKTSGLVDNGIQSQASANRRESHQAELVVEKVNMDADDKHAGRPVLSESEHQPLTAAPKKSWQQLFTRSSVNSYVVCNSNGPTASGSCFSFVNEHMLPHVGEMHHESLQEEQELFEDPGFVPDPMSLLDKSPILKNVIAPSEVSRPSPIQSPLSRLKISHDIRTPALDDSKNTDEKGTWQMWNSHPLVQATWLLPPKKTGSTKENCVSPPSDNNMSSFFTNDLVFESPSKSATIHPFGLPPPTCVSKNEWAVHGSGDKGVADSSVLKSHIGRLYYTPHVQSLWAYD